MTKCQGTTFKQVKLPAHCCKTQWKHNETHRQNSRQDKLALLSPLRSAWPHRCALAELRPKETSMWQLQAWITESSGLEATSKDHLVQPPAKAGPAGPGSLFQCSSVQRSCSSRQSETSRVLVYGHCSLSCRWAPLQKSLALSFETFICTNEIPSQSPLDWTGPAAAVSPLTRPASPHTHRLPLKRPCQTPA